MRPPRYAKADHFDIISRRYGWCGCKATAECLGIELGMVSLIKRFRQPAGEKKQRFHLQQLPRIAPVSFGGT